MYDLNVDILSFFLGFFQNFLLINEVLVFFIVKKRVGDWRESVIAKYLRLREWVFFKYNRD